MQVHADVEILFYTLFHSSKKKETYKKNNYTVACNDIICALLKITEISLLIQHFVEAAAVIVSGFFGYIFTTGQSNKANRVKLLKIQLYTWISAI